MEGAHVTVEVEFSRGMRPPCRGGDAFHALLTFSVRFVAVLLSLTREKVSLTREKGLLRGLCGR
jgi:hypothetical protein